MTTTPDDPADRSLVTTLRVSGSRMRALQVRGTFVDIESGPNRLAVPVRISRGTVVLHHAKLAAATTVRGKIRRGPVYLDGTLHCTSGRPTYGFGVIVKGALRVSGAARALLKPRITTCTYATRGDGLQATLTGGWSLTVQGGTTGTIHLSKGPTTSWTRPPTQSRHPSLTRRHVVFTFAGTPLDADHARGKPVLLTGFLACPAGTLPR